MHFLTQTANPRRLIDYYNGKSRELQCRMAEEWQSGAIRQSPSAQETVIQIFYTSDGIYREMDSINARIGHENWKDVSIALPAGAGVSALRIDFLSALNVIDIASIRVLRSGQVLFQAAAPAEFHKIDIRGDADRLPHSNFLRLQFRGSIRNYICHRSLRAPGTGSSKSDCASTPESRAIKKERGAP